jgi:hypothetical protein
VSRGTWEFDWRASAAFAYRTITFCGRTFQIVRLADWFVTHRPRRDRTASVPTTPDAQRSRAITCTRFRLFPFRSPLLGESLLLSFPGGTEMVHFPPLASHPLLNSGVDSRGFPAGFPHSETLGSVPACGSPRLIAAYRVLHRPRAPRHPPYALSSLTMNGHVSRPAPLRLYRIDCQRTIGTVTGSSLPGSTPGREHPIPSLVENTGFEPVTSWLQTRRSPS